MYVSMSRLRIHSERAPELVAAFRDRVGLVDGFEGVVDLRDWQSGRDAGELVMVSRWDTRAHFTAYMRSREHKVSHGRIDPGLDAAIALERLEHLHTYEVVGECARGRAPLRRRASRRRGARSSPTARSST